MTTDAPTVLTLTPTCDWVIVRKIDSPLAPKSTIYTVNRDPNGPEYGVVLKIGPDVPAGVLAEGDTVLLGAGVGQAVQFGPSSTDVVHFIEWTRRDIKAVIS